MDKVTSVKKMRTDRRLLAASRTRVFVVLLWHADPERLSDELLSQRSGSVLYERINFEAWIRIPKAQRKTLTSECAGSTQS